MTEFYVIKKSAGYAVKTLPSEVKARKYADDCCKRTGLNNNYCVAVYKGGQMVEI